MIADVQGYDLAPDQSRILVQDGKDYVILEPKEGAPRDKTLDLSGLRMELDPRAEWAQIFGDTWRIERDFFYLPDMGQIDWPAMRRRYEPLLPYVSHRTDLTYLTGELAGELGSGHSYVGRRRPAPAREGARGRAGRRADASTRKAGAWRIAHIYPAETWTEKRRSPLTEPGAKVEEGEYLLAIDGHDLKPTDEPYRLLLGRAERIVTLLVNKTPSRTGAREVAVRTLADEDVLRYHDWVERNRQKVDKATNGRVGYVHIPDMGGNGLQEFIRQYYPQLRKEALVVDVRANGGGFVSEMILERLRRVVMGMGSTRGARPGHLSHLGLLRADGGPHQRLLRERRRHLPLLLPRVWPRPAHRHAHLGRRRGHPRQPEPGGRRLRVRARVRHLQREGRVDHRERGSHARHRGGQPARATRWRARTRSSRAPCRRS